MSSEKTALAFNFAHEMTVKHDNADSLNVLTIPGTEYNYVLNNEEWKDYKGMVAFIEPDTIFPLENVIFHPFIPFCKNGRVRAKKIRGIQSYGILVRQPETEQWTEGENVYERLNLSHYDAEMVAAQSNNKLNPGECAKAPSGDFPKYDVENAMKYANKVFTQGEKVWVTEKIHGANACYVYKDGQMNCRSRNLWKKEYEGKPEVDLEALRAKGVSEENIERICLKMENWKPTLNTWWKVLANTPALRAFCEANEGVAVYGEIYGNVKGFKYDTPGGEPNMKFRAFDLLREGKWVNAPEAYEMLNKSEVPMVPLISNDFPFDFDYLKATCVGQSTLNDTHIREGIVIKPLVERWNQRLGRVQVKLVSPVYLEKY